MKYDHITTRPFQTRRIWSSSDESLVLGAGNAQRIWYVAMLWFMWGSDTSTVSGNYCYPKWFISYSEERLDPVLKISFTFWFCCQSKTEVWYILNCWWLKYSCLDCHPVFRYFQWISITHTGQLLLSRPWWDFSSFWYHMYWFAGFGGPNVLNRKCCHVYWDHSCS